MTDERRPDEDEIRETFGARGRVVSQAGLREWWNGNLHVLEEVTETGHRLRLHTTKETGLIANQIAAAVAALAVVIVLVIAPAGRLAEAMGGPFVLFGIALAALGFNALTLPPWARQRERQMEQIAARARALTEGGPEDRERVALRSRWLSVGPTSPATTPRSHWSAAMTGRPR